MKLSAMWWLFLFPFLFGYMLWMCYRVDTERKRFVERIRRLSPEIWQEIFDDNQRRPFDPQAKFEVWQFQQLLGHPSIEPDEELKSTLGIAILFIPWIAVWLWLWLIP